MSLKPLVSGFTFIKNGLTLGYPILESIQSIDPICDEVVINVGHDEHYKDDGTYEYLRDHLKGHKYKFIRHMWDPALTRSGEILALQTNLALNHCQGRYCQYIQADEILHERDFSRVEEGIGKLEDHPEIMGLLFHFTHFYGNVDIVKYTRNIYRREIRLIRGGCGIQSWKDAQGFRDSQNAKLIVLDSKARIYHYGWARQEKVMKKKVLTMDKLYHGKEYENPRGFQYERVWGLHPFRGAHPKVMEKWIQEHRNQFHLDALPKSYVLKEVPLMMSDFFERITGIRIGEYKNYKKTSV